jgi:hypothetical protein
MILAFLIDASFTPLSSKRGGIRERGAIICFAWRDDISFTSSSAPESSQISWIRNVQ